MSGGNISYIDKAELIKTLCIGCIKYNWQFKVHFLAEKHNMKQYPANTFLVCEFSGLRVVGKLVFLVITFFLSSIFFLKMFKRKEDNS